MCVVGSPNAGICPFRYFFSVRGNDSSFLRLKPNQDIRKKGAKNVEKGKNVDFA